MSSGNATPAETPLSRQTILAVAVAALGYFVDLFDLVLFSIVRVPSLKALGVTEADVVASLEAGDIKGKKIGSAWRVTKTALDQFLAQ